MMSRKGILLLNLRYIVYWELLRENSPTAATATHPVRMLNADVLVERALVRSGPTDATWTNVLINGGNGAWLFRG